MRRIADVADGEDAASGCLHIVVDLEIAVRIGRECKPGKPGLVGCRPVAEQHHDIIGDDLLATAQSKSDSRAGLV